MPALHYRLKWPDGSESTSYSPSLVIQDFLHEGTDYPVDDFLRRLREATAIANDRVQAKFGFVCSRVNDQLVDSQARAEGFAHRADARVRVVSFESA